MKRAAIVTLLILSAWTGAVGETYRLYDSLTAFVSNPDGKEFTIALDVRDVNRLGAANGEMLLKVYDPSGRAISAQVVPDDGVQVGTYAAPAAGWDHEAWYCATAYSRGMEPQQRWSNDSDPRGLAATPERTFVLKIPGGEKGTYRVLLVGRPDLYVSLRLDPELPYSVAGGPDWLHGHGGMYRKSFLYLPAGVSKIHLLFLQLDQPARRHVVLRDSEGNVLLEGTGGQGLVRQVLSPAEPGRFDDKLLTVEVSEGEGDFLLGLTLEFDQRIRPTRGPLAVAAVLSDDEATARATRGGAIYHDGIVFWQMYAVRLHEWLKTLPEADFQIPGNLPKRGGYISVGSHNRPPGESADVIMHSYGEHKDRNSLNAAIREMLTGLRLIGPTDAVAIGPCSNLAYEMGCYAFFYHRPAWRIIRQSEAPEEVKDILREFLIQIGDRLAFCRGGELINGNALASLVAAQQYCLAGTDDELQKQLFDTYFARFASGGFGDRVGIGPSGGVQESMGYDYHYGSYVLRGWRAALADLDVPQLRKAYDGVLNLYSYIYCPVGAATPFNSRTSHQIAGGTYDPQSERFRWKGHSGPDLTETVNGANELFAARQRDYYVVAYYGRLTPTWMGEGFHGQIGLGGGAICQLTVPDKGTVLHSSLNGSYGSGMHVSQWRNFHVHGLVGMTADGQPLVAANCEMPDARLADNTVIGDAEVSQSSVHVWRSYAFEPDAIACSVKLGPSIADKVFGLWGGRHGLRGVVTEAYEMIPYADIPANQRKGKWLEQMTRLVALDAEGKTVGQIADKPVDAAAILIDRHGYGVRIELDQARPVVKGKNDTVLIRLVDAPTPAEQVECSYRIVPYVGEIEQAAAGAAPGALPLLRITPEGPPGELKSYPIKDGKDVLAEVSFALAGDSLAVAAAVTDASVAQDATPWRGSCLEVFGATSGSYKIGQVFLVPGVGEQKPVAYQAVNGRQKPTDDIRLTSTPTDSGYVLKAEIPLRLLAVDSAETPMLLEAQITTHAPDGKVRRGTVFGSERAYENNRRYGLFEAVK